MIFAGIFAAQAVACSIPVFRYALENWQPDPYVAIVLHRGELTTEQQQTVQELRSNDAAQSGAPHLIVRTIDLDVESDAYAAELAKENVGGNLPAVLVQTPARSGEQETVFAAELTSANVARLTDSPLRRDISSRLLKGDSVVWVYLECGIEEQDNEKFSMLSGELARLQGELKLPEIEDEDLSDLTADPESLRIRFSAVRLSRDDVLESAFRDMLLHVEHDLRDEPYLDQPMAFPVFGRGRALYALVGDGVAPDLIREACEFLTGACQCTVKAENPGVDILMKVDWDSFIEPTEAVESNLPPLAGFSGFGDAADENTTDIQLSQNTVTPETVNTNQITVEDPPTSGMSVEPQQSQAGDLQITGVQPAVAEDGATVALVDMDSSATNVVMQNVVYVLLFAGVAVVVATILLTRRQGS
ncbi:MAG: hypothetical protein MK110_12005 [Fuerstiella sp.]|nr:hypothetical protein [Fuerstiella sp.]